MRYTKLLPIERPGSTIGFGVGLGADYIVNDNFSINGKMFYEKKGGRFNIDAGTYDFVTKMHGVAKGAIHEIDRLDYLTVPIMLNYSLLHKTPLSVGFGPFVSYLLRAQHTEENTIIKQGYIGDFTRNFRRIDLDSRLLLGPISH